MDNIGIAVLCRFNSSRLPGKILKEIDEKPIIHHIHDRLSLLIPNEQIVITTSTEESDDPIANYCHKNGFQVFRGDLNNVAKRFNDVGQKYQWEYTIRINGDNLFIDLDTMKEMMAICLSNNYDFVSNVKGRTFPYGMSIEIVNRKFYHSIFPKFSSNDRFIEHVTLFLYENPEIGKQYHHKNTKILDMRGVKLAIDEQVDFDFAVQLMNLLKIKNYQYNLQDLNQIIKTIDVEKLAR